MSNNMALSNMTISPGGRKHVAFKLNKKKSFHQNYIQLDRANRKRVKQMALALHRPHIHELCADMLAEYVCEEAFNYRAVRGWFCWNSTVVKQYPRSVFLDHDVPAEDPAWRNLDAEFDLVDDVNSK